jgi:hypothetical protein
MPHKKEAFKITEFRQFTAELQESRANDIEHLS